MRHLRFAPQKKSQKMTKSDTSATSNGGGVVGSALLLTLFWAERGQFGGLAEQPPPVGDQNSCFLKYGTGISLMSLKRMKKQMGGLHQMVSIRGKKKTDHRMKNELMS